jgi:hypothetical protein
MKISTNDTNISIELKQMFKVLNQAGILGAERRAPPLVRLSPAVSSLLSRIAKHVGLSNAKIK